MLSLGNGTPQPATFTKVKEVTLSNFQEEVERPRTQHLIMDYANDKLVSAEKVRQQNNTNLQDPR